MAWDLVKDDYYSQSKSQLKTNDFTSHFLVSSPKDDSVPHSDNNCASIDGFKSKALPQKIMNYSMLANASADRPKVIENEIA